jgi:hypothetical protein
MIVMAGLVPAIHVLLFSPKAWMPGTRPGMTSERFAAAKSRVCVKPACLFLIET